MSALIWSIWYVFLNCCAWTWDQIWPLATVYDSCVRLVILAESEPESDLVSFCINTAWRMDIDNEIWNRYISEKLSFKILVQLQFQFNNWLQWQLPWWKEPTTSHHPSNHCVCVWSMLCYSNCLHVDISCLIINYQLQCQSWENKPSTKHSWHTSHQEKFTNNRN